MNIQFSVFNSFKRSAVSGRWSVVSLIAILLLTLTSGCSTYAGTGTVSAEVLNLRSSPSIKGTILKGLPRGTVVTTYEKTGDWMRVFPQGGIEGYVPSKLVSKGKLTGAAEFRTTVKGASVGTLGAKDTIKVLGTEGTWTRVQVTKSTGLKMYVSSNYLTTGTSAAAASTAASAEKTAVSNGKYAGLKPSYGVLVYNATQNKEIWSQNADKVMPIASLTKMMTLLLALEKLAANPDITLDSMVPISVAAANEAPTKACLIAGQKVKLRELLSVMIIISCNDCAACAGEFIAGSREGFAKAANERAKKLGMTHTKFFNANGLPMDKPSFDNVSTPRELLILMKELWKHPQAREWVKMPTVPMTTGIDKPTTFHGHTPLLGKYGVDGIKTGYTRRARSCVATHAKLPGGEYYIVLLGCESGASRNVLLENIMKTLH